MNKLFLALGFSCTLLQGCSKQTDSYEINISTNICKDHGGIDYINNFLNMVRCNDGLVKGIEVSNQ